MTKLRVFSRPSVGMIGGRVQHPFETCQNRNTLAQDMKLKCPICRQPTDSLTNAEFPFCSERCRERDLGNWAMEKYKVAVPMMDESEPEEVETNERVDHESSDNDE